MNSIGPSSSPSEARFPRKGILNIRLPHIVISDRTLEALKWIALLLMTGDHVNKYLFNGTKEWLFDFGRLAMPLFVFVLAYNLARPDTLARGVYHRTIWRLFFVGCLSTPPFIALGNVAYGWWPFNIMFTLAATAGVLLLIDRGSMSRYAMAGALFVAAGSVVEFCWPALGLGVATWLYVRRPSWMTLGVAVAALGGVLYVNGNGWAILAIPLAWAASRANLGMPRLRWAFYSYYPLHLVALLLIRIPMSKMGYLFF